MVSVQLDTEIMSTRQSRTLCRITFRQSHIFLVDMSHCLQSDVEVNLISSKLSLVVIREAYILYMYMYIYICIYIYIYYILYYKQSHCL